MAMGGGLFTWYPNKPSTPGVYNPIYVGPRSSFNSLSDLAYDTQTDTLWMLADAVGQLVLIQFPSKAQPYQRVFALRSKYRIYASLAVDHARSLAYVLSKEGIDTYDVSSLREIAKDSVGLPVINSNVNDPVRKISFGRVEAVDDFALDSKRDRLYAVDGPRQEIVIVDRASSASGVGPYEAIAVPSPITASMDPTEDRLYVGDNSERVWIFDKASTLGGGSPLPNATVVARDGAPMGPSAVWSILVQ